MSLNQMQDKYLRRYTDLPFLLELLQTNCLTLLSPHLWADTNDSYFLNVAMSNRNSSKSVQALCFTTATETHHHWKVFTSGPSGVCVDFHKHELVDVVKKYRVQAGPVSYPTLVELNAKKGTPQIAKSLPFLKRYAFRDEEEYRLVHFSKTDEAVFRVPIPRRVIAGVQLSPYLNDEVGQSVIKLLKSAKHFDGLNIKRSLLLDNKQWKKIIQNND